MFTGTSVVFTDFTPNLGGLFVHDDHDNYDKKDIMMIMRIMKSMMMRVLLMMS